MKFQPWPYQERGRRFMLRHPFNAMFLDMGLGKTVLALTAIKDLLDGLDISAALVVAPIRVAETTWPDEAAQWDHLRGLRLQVVRGSARIRAALLQVPADIYLINYELIPWLMEWAASHIKARTLPFDMVVFDESSKMKSHSAKRYKKIKPLLPLMRRRTIMTGTPAPNNYLDLFSQQYLVDLGKVFGPYYTHFRDRYFDFNQYTYETKIKPGAAKEIRRLMRPTTLAMRSEDYLKLPAIIYNDIKVPLPKPVMAQYNELEKEMFLQLDKAEIEAFNAAALTTKCRQLTSGVLYDAEGGHHTVHDAKLDALADVLEDAGGRSVLVVYEFRSELERLLKRWPKAPWIGGGSKDAQGAIRRWNAGGVPVMFVHPASVGHGINLQRGGHIVCWTSSTWSLELYQQMNKRLHRQGQPHPVMVHHLVCPGTVDEVVRDVLRTKAAGMAALMRALRRQKGLAD